MLKLGFIGTGHLAEAVIGGLQKTHGERVDILLSPRNVGISQKLAATYPNVRRAASNADVVDGSNILFLGMLPRQLSEVTAGWPFDRNISLSASWQGPQEMLCWKRLRQLPAS